MDWVRKKSLVNNCTETVLEKLLALCLQSDRGYEVHEVMGLMVSWYALSVTYLALAQVQKNLGEVTIIEPWLLLFESKWNKKCSIHLVFLKEHQWNSIYTICIGSLHHSGNPDSQRAKSLKSWWKIRNAAKNSFMLQDPNTKQYCVSASAISINSQDVAKI